MGLKRSSHAVYDTNYHLVWCPKRRKDIFAEKEIRERAEQVVREICDEYGFDITEMEVAENHIGEVVRIIKSISARQLFREFPRLKKRLWTGQLWEDGYFARTVGDRMTRQIIEKYIKHHRDIEQGPTQLF